MNGQQPKLASMCHNLQLWLHIFDEWFLILKIVIPLLYVLIPSEREASLMSCISTPSSKYRYLCSMAFSHPKLAGHLSQLHGT